MTFDPQKGVCLGPHTVLFWFSAHRPGLERARAFPSIVSCSCSKYFQASDIPGLRA